MEEKNELDQELAAAKSGKYPPIEIKEFPKTTPILKTPTYDKNIFVIIDNGCGSSCESTLDALRVHPRVKVD
ncbi:MAG: hypothetical protein IPM97_08125 [Bdellovibrionaceae bacterium]|nr:hypothetical protein [Pseudobdellovibrionaceae bacterium]